MATTTVSDAVVVPQAKGTGLSSEDDNVDAAAAALLAAYNGNGGYVRSGMGFTRDDANNEIDVAAGFCYIVDDSTSTSGSRGTGGNAQVQSTSSSGYDTEIPDNQVYLVIFPTSNTVAVSDGTASDIWVNITSVTSNNSVELRSSSGGGTTAEPSDTFLKLGNITDSGSGQATRSNDRKGDPSKIHLQTNTPSGASESTFTTGISAAFKRFEFDLIDVVPATDAVNLQVQVSTDGGSNWKSGASDYEYAVQGLRSDGTGASANGEGASHIQLNSNDIGSESGQALEGWLKLSNPANGSVRQYFDGQTSYSEWGGGDDTVVASIAGSYQTAESINGVRFQFSSGNIESGTIAMYGVVT